MDTKGSKMYYFYKLCCRDISITDIYIGSTINFKRRKQEHKYRCINENKQPYKLYNTYVYEYIRKHGNWKNWDVVEIARHECNDKQEAHKIERKYIEDLKATLNVVIPSRTEKEWYNDNNDYVLENRKQYYIEHREKELEYNKKWMIEHKDERQKYSKDRYNKNRINILNKNKIKYTCDICNEVSTLRHKARHEKSKKHIANMAKSSYK